MLAPRIIGDRFFLLGLGLLRSRFELGRREMGTSQHFRPAFSGDSRIGFLLSSTCSSVSLTATAFDGDYPMDQEMFSTYLKDR